MSTSVTQHGPKGIPLKFNTGNGAVYEYWRKSKYFADTEKYGYTVTIDYPAMVFEVREPERVEDAVVGAVEWSKKPHEKDETFDVEAFLNPVTPENEASSESSSAIPSDTASSSATALPVDESSNSTPEVRQSSESSSLPASSDTASISSDTATISSDTATISSESSESSSASSDAAQQPPPQDRQPKKPKR